MNYFLSKMTAKILGNLGTDYDVYSDAFFSRRDIRQKLLKVENQAKVMPILLLRMEVRLPSDKHTRRGLAAQVRLKSTSLKYRLSDRN